MADAVLTTGWGADDPVDDSVIRQFLWNQADAVDTMGGGPGSRHDRTTDVTLCDSAGPVPYLNQAVLLRPVTTVTDPVLDTVEQFFDRGNTGDTGTYAGGRPVMMLSVWPLPDLSARGWHVVGHPMFVVRPPGPVTHTPADGVAVRRVTTIDDLRVLERIAIEGYPLDEARDLPPGAVFGDWFLGSPVGLHLGLVAGEPVAAGAVHVGHGVANLCFAATLPSARRRGAWSAVMWDRVAVAPDHTAVAFTSDDSRPGFVKHGFLPVTRFTLLVRIAPGRDGRA